MRNLRLASLLVCSCASLLGCNAPSSTGRPIVGTLSVGTYRLDNPVLIAESSDHRVFITHVARDGRFRLQLPTDVSYRLTVANTTRSGYAALGRVNWPLTVGASRWARVAPGATLDLGAVYRRGSAPASSGLSTKCDTCGGGGGGGGGDEHGSDSSGGKAKDESDHDCHEDDHAKPSHPADEDDCDCEHEVSDKDGCDKDDEEKKHDQECDKDEGGHDGKGDGGECTSCGGSTPTAPTAPTGGNGGNGGNGGKGAAGSPCSVNADCGSGLQCVQSACVTGGPVQ